MTLYFNYPCICTFESLKSFTFSVHLGYQHIFFKRIFFKKKFFCSLKEFLTYKFHQIGPIILLMFNHSFVSWFICSFVHSFVHKIGSIISLMFNHSFVCWFICFLVHSFVHQIGPIIGPLAVAGRVLWIRVCLLVFLFFYPSVFPSFCPEVFLGLAHYYFFGT